jgi:hypothetical protein
MISCRSCDCVTKICSETLLLLLLPTCSNTCLHSQCSQLGSSGLATTQCPHAHSSNATNTHQRNCTAVLAQPHLTQPSPATPPPLTKSLDTP